MIGETIGHYAVQEKIGAGGMGEIYRAHDTQLDRDVALKLLPDTFAGDAERIARFRREARTLASLNHPNIAAIFGLDESTEKRFLVMELVEGEDLAVRLRRGALPVGESLDIARQIADGLEDAHERGIIHRDLKPANVMITPEGKVKILDFGLARAYEGGGGDEPDLSRSPTLTGAYTEANVILGTAGYMSPEQAKGKRLDRRTDLWAFGVILWEMLTGKRLFEGDGVSDTLAAVLRAEIPLDELPADLPAPVRRLLTRCLERDPRNRLRDIGEARVRLEQWTSDPSSLSEIGDQDRVAPGPAARLPWVIAAAAIVAAVFGWARRGGDGPPGELEPTRVCVHLPAGAIMEDDFWVQAMAISPDGRDIVYRGWDHDADVPQLLRRSLGSDDVAPIGGPKVASTVFFSPDGKSIVFDLDEHSIGVSSIDGGTVVELTSCDEITGGSWSDDGSIVFAPGLSSGICRIPERGGEISILTEPDRERGEVSHRLPFALPGGRGVLFTIKNDRILDFSDATIAVVPMEGGEVRTLIEGGCDPAYLPTGHLVYFHGGSLLAVPFDLERLQVTGSPVSLVEGVAYDPASGGVLYAFSSNGTLAYVKGGSVRVDLRLVQVNDDGEVVRSIGPPAQYFFARAAPEGGRLVVGLPSANNKLWLLDIERDVLTRLTFGPGNDGAAVWGPRGEWIYFASDRDGARGLFRVHADGADEQALLPATAARTPGSVTRDGRALIYTETDEETGDDLWILPLDQADASPRPFLRTNFDESSPRISPGGDLLLYVSNESGRDELYLRRFPDASGKIRVTRDGVEDRMAGWRKDGREIVYHNETRWLVVSVEPGPRPRVGRPRPLGAEPADVHGTDVLNDGSGFLSVDFRGFVPAIPPRIELVFNWFEDVKRRAGSP